MTTTQVIFDTSELRYNIGTQHRFKQLAGWMTEQIAQHPTERLTHVAMEKQDPVVYAGDEEAMKLVLTFEPI
jgi:hypothetical protein